MEVDVFVCNHPASLCTVSGCGCGFGGDDDGDDDFGCDSVDDDDANFGLFAGV